MPLGRSRDLNSAPQLTPEEQKAKDKAKRMFQMILDDAADEQEAVLVTVLKDLGEKEFGNGKVQGYLIRLIILTGEHADHLEDELPIYKRGFTYRIGRAVERDGVGTSFVARLERYGDRRAIGLTDDKDGDYDLAEAALAKHGDPFDEARARQAAAGNGSRSITEEVDAAKRSVKTKAAARAATAVDDPDAPPPF